MAREADRRYAHLLGIFLAQRLVDPYTPTAPSLPARRFELDRQIPEDEVEALLRMVLEAPEIDAPLARRISQRVGRPLEPFDIWYPGFGARSGRQEEDLGRQGAGCLSHRRRSSSKRRCRASWIAWVSRAERARWLAEDASWWDRARGAGHALGRPAPRGPGAPAHAHRRRGHGLPGLQRRHARELGHNVEQVFSLHGIDHWWLGGVPNNAFTEAIAYHFQER